MDIKFILLLPLNSHYLFRILDIYIKHKIDWPLKNTRALVVGTCTVKLDRPNIPATYFVTSKLYNIKALCQLVLLNRHQALLKCGLHKPTIGCSLHKLMIKCSPYGAPVRRGSH